MTAWRAPSGTPLWGSLTAKAIDRETSSRYLIPSLVLMEEAGRAVARIVRERIAQSGPKNYLVPDQVLVLAGPGNNGGDALVTARYLREWGIPTHTIMVMPTADTQLSESCQHQRLVLERLGCELGRYVSGCLATWSHSVPNSHVWIVDGILGLGGRPDIPGTSVLGMALREASTLRNKTVVAVDVPSGLDVDDGSQTKVWLRSDITVTFGERKPALVLSPARDLSGEVITRDIGFPRQAVEDGLREHPALWQVPDDDALLEINPWQKLGPSAHKYDRGHVLIIGGSLGKTGAPLLSALSSLRTGAGWATVAMAQDVMASLRGDVPREIVFEDLFEPKDGSNYVLDAKKLYDFVGRGRVKSIVIGPGTMGSPLTLDALAVIGEFCSRGGFAVFDAGACHGLIPLLKTLPQPTASVRKWVMTPHPGEWTKLGLDDPSPPLKPSLWKKTQSLAAQVGMAMLYKSATPALFLGDGEGPALVSTAGSKILARAGSGDILAGAIAAHGAQGLDLATSVMRGQILLAQAAQRAAQRLGDDAVLAHDVLEDIGRVTPHYRTS